MSETPADTGGSTASLITPEVLDAIALWLPERRWFGGKGRAIRGVTTALDQPMSSDEPIVHDVVLSVHYVDGGSDLYHVPLAWRADVPERLVASVITRSNGQAVYDALVDPEASSVFLERLASGEAIGALTFGTTGTPVQTGLQGHMLTAEQSNTSVVYGDEYILKVFRRLAHGVNPDVEINVGLARVESTNVPRPLGWLEATVNGEQVTTGFLQEFLRTAADGWTMATTSVRDLYAEADLHADEVGGDFAAEAARIGAMTGAVHTELREVFGTEPRGSDHVQMLAARMQARLDDAVLAVPELLEAAPRISELYRRFGREILELRVQRIHGDYHLGQVLRSHTGWVALDFEGEPARPLAERREMDTPLRDVAGMLRSFDYAARSLLQEWQGQPHLVYRAEEWSSRNREAFCEGYGEVTGKDPRKDDLVLRAFEVDKAVYEVLYEARNRPTWLVIPMGSIERLVSA
ncbi:MAG: putative pep2 protein [Frankiales bacterium]|nr:putative pep2 protein [Frankiales bacterium]